MSWYSWLQIVSFVVLLILGFSVGSYVERAHFRSLALREAALKDMPLTDMGFRSSGIVPRSAELVCGEVVIATDYFKTFAAQLRKLIGGELRAYETLLERGRREAIVRMQEQARLLGADAVVNVRLSSSTISGLRRNRAAMVEVFAYGTAVWVTSARAE